MAQNNPNRKTTIIIVLFTIALLSVTLYLKIGTDTSREAENPMDTRATPAIAVPDTTTPPEAKEFSEPETSAPAPADSIERDPRPADEAGAEDGYWNGYYDGTARRKPSPDDVSSTFPTRNEREIYAKNYTEGYRKGYEEGIRNLSSGE